jgi:hypothetical protein
LKLPAKFSGEQDVQTISSTAPGVVITPLNKRWIDDPRKRVNVKNHAPLGWPAKAGVFPFFALRDAATAVAPNADGAGPFQCSLHLDPAVGSEEARNIAAAPTTNDVLRRFNRETEWLAAGILGVLIFAALMLATSIQEGQPKAVDQAKEERQTDGNALVNANPDTLCKAVGLLAESFTGEVSSSPQETPLSRIETAASMQIPALELTSGGNEPALPGERRGLRHIGNDCATGAGNPATSEGAAEADEIRNAQEINSEY